MQLPIEKQIEQSAENDAIAGIHQGDLARQAALGKKPVWDTDGNPEHAKATEMMNRGPQRDDLNAQLEVEHERIGQVQTPPLFMALTIAIAAVVESTGSTIIMKNCGFEPPVLFGITLAAAVFALVSLTRKTRDYRSYLVIAALVTLSFAVASLRAREAVGDEGDGGPSSWAMGVIALVMTIGPALWAEPALRELGMLFPHLRRRRRLAKQHAQLERDIKAAEAFSEKHKKSQLAWEDTDHRLKARYDIAHARKRAEIESTNPTQ
ncbi:MAG: hypothetical protein WB973_17100 [Thermoanaerobaculia bacterium]